MNKQLLAISVICMASVVQNMVIVLMVDKNAIEKTENSYVITVPQCK